MSTCQSNIDSTYSIVFKECKCWASEGNRDFSPSTSKVSIYVIQDELWHSSFLCQHLWISSPFVSVTVKILKIYNQFLRGAFSILFDTCCIVRYLGQLEYDAQWSHVQKEITIFKISTKIITNMSSIAVKYKIFFLLLSHS